MKHLLLFSILLSTSAFGRQYIQCNSEDFNSTDVAVVNLETEKGGTLMISPGMEYDQYVLMDISFLKQEGNKHFYSLQGREGHVSLASSAIGKNLNSLRVDLNYQGFEISYICFSRIYEE